MISLTGKPSKKSRKAKRPAAGRRAARKATSRPADNPFMSKLDGDFDPTGGFRKDAEKSFALIFRELESLKSSRTKDEKEFGGAKADLFLVNKVTKDLSSRVSSDSEENGKQLAGLSKRADALETGGKELDRLLAEIDVAVKKIIASVSRLSGQVVGYKLEADKNKVLAASTSGRVEELSSIMQKDVTVLQELVGKTDSNAEAIRGILKDLKDVGPELQDMDKRVTDMESGYKAGLNQLKDVMEKFLAGMKETGIDKALKELESHGTFRKLLMKDDIDSLVTRREFDELKIMVDTITKNGRYIPTLLREGEGVRQEQVDRPFNESDEEGPPGPEAESEWPVPGNEPEPAEEERPQVVSKSYAKSKQLNHLIGSIGNTKKKLENLLGKA